MTPPRYSSVRLRASVADDLRRLTRRVAAEADLDASQSDVLESGLAYLSEHTTEIAARVKQAAERSEH